MKHTKIFATLLALGLGLAGAASLTSCGEKAADPQAYDLIIEGAHTIYRNETLQLSILSHQLEDDGVRWSSDATAVATVSDSGLVTGVSAGIATITAEVIANPDYSTYVTIAVRDEPAAESFAVRFLNYDGEVLARQTVERGGTASYTGETPERIADEDYYYAFTGWDRDLSEPIVADTDFTAEYGRTQWGNDWSFVINQDTNTYYVSQWNGFASSVTIPTSYNYRAVTGINTSCFENDTNLQEVILHDGITVIGNYAFRSCSLLKRVVGATNINAMGVGAFYLCSSLESIDMKGELNQVPNYTFWGCTSLAEASMPEGIEAIGANAFYNCSSLTSISIPSAYFIYPEAFYFCSKMTSYTFSPNLYYIGDRAFGFCDLEKVTISKNMRYVGTNAFVGNEKIASIALEEGSKYFYIDEDGYALYQNEVTETVDENDIITDVTIDKEAATLIYACPMVERASYTIKEGCEAIAAYAFAQSHLKEVTIPKSVTDVGTNAFSYSTLLSKVTFEFDEAATHDVDLNVMTFYQCDALETITLPNGITTIGEQSFYGCEKMATIALPDSVTTLESMCFYESGLTNINMPDGITEIPTMAFGHCRSLAEIDLSNITAFTGTYAFSGCYALAKVTMPASVTELGVGSFAYCTSLTEIAIPTMAGRIPDGFLRGSTAIKNLVVPDGYTGLGESCFSSMTALETLTLPAEITTIGKYAFGHTDALKTIDFKGTTEQWTTIMASVSYDVHVGYGSNEILKSETLTINCLGDPEPTDPETPTDPAESGETA